MSPPRPTRGSLSEKVWFQFTGLHARLYRLSGGRIGRKMSGAPILLLDHVGRKSGVKRTTPLIYTRDGEKVVLIASYGGAEKHPFWWLNLRDAGEADIQIGSEGRHVHVREAEGEERERLWAVAVAGYGDYAVYQTRTERRIPVVVLE